jgi:hypothetical protein
MELNVNMSNCRPHMKNELQIRPNVFYITHFTAILIKKTLNSSVFWVIMEHGLVRTDVSGLPIGHIFKGQVLDASSWKLGS